MSPPGQKPPDDASSIGPSTGVAPPLQTSSDAGLDSLGPSPFFTPPSIELPPPGGAIRGLGEKFSVDAVTGTAGVSIPISTSPARSGGSAAPQIHLSYSSGAGNGPFGLGWCADVPSITRSTDKRLPRYIDDGPEADVFVLSGAEDLVPAKVFKASAWSNDVSAQDAEGKQYTVTRFVPRTEGLFSKIERWVETLTGDTHWRSITSDNKTALFGIDQQSRIADPENPNLVFSWQVCATYDSAGNASVWEYKAEDSVGIQPGWSASERNRTDRTRSANRYLKRIKYGNLVSRLLDPDIFAANREWLFEAVFDYGEHDLISPLPTEDVPWSVRNDPFSAYRSGFDVRTYRLCRRVLMFHNFTDEPDIGANCLVASTNMTYEDAASDKHTFLASVSYAGYMRSGTGYTSKFLPPVELTYSKPTIAADVWDVKTRNVPSGLSGEYEFLDLNGEGIAGIFTSSAISCYFKPNLGEGQFEDPISVLRPNSGAHSFLDIDHDGRLEYVSFSQPFLGYASRWYLASEKDDTIMVEENWGSLHSFSSIPNVSMQDPNVTLVDLTGDGLADILITDDSLFTYYPSLGTAGFAAGIPVHVALDEEKGPRCVLADPMHTIHIADMSGDGLSDIVRIRNGDVCYWPNLGYGRFGARVVMDLPTCLDTADVFDSNRVILADVDGSGTTDIVYVDAAGTVKIHFNKSGNGFMDGVKVGTFPAVSSAINLKVVDLLGKGTACLVWSSPLPGDAQNPFRYIDLMQDKPNLLISVLDNRGSETRYHYASSTKFYLQDKAAGNPWITRLPFPVQVVEYIENYDYISGNRFATRYAYHHGYYDGIEREFRGFALAEKWETEELTLLGSTWPKAMNDLSYSDTPPILTKTWYHNGAYIQEQSLQSLLRREYYKEPGLTDEEAAAQTQLSDSSVPEMIFTPDSVEQWNFSDDELREAHRAMRGKELRTEVYALDGSEAELHPYSVTESTFMVRLLQPRSTGQLQYAVFHPTPQETLSLHYERQSYVDATSKILMDPRTVHTLTLTLDYWGNPLRTASVGYSRRRDEPDVRLTALDRAKQRRTLATYTERTYTNAVEGPDVNQLPIVCEQRGFELVNLASKKSELFTFATITAIVSGLESKQDLPYDDYDGSQATEDRPYRRLVAWSRNLFRKDDLSAPLPLGQLESRGIPFETYSFAASAASMKSAYVDPGKIESSELESILLQEGHFVHGSDGSDQNWWTRTGLVFFTDDTTATPQQELEAAIHGFFGPRRYQSPFHTAQHPNFRVVDYDRYSLLVQETRDSLGNRSTAGERAVDPKAPLLRKGLDYRVLRPTISMNPNRNRSAIYYDELGSAVAMAVMGKPEEQLGDSLESFRPSSDEAVLKFLSNPRADRSQILQNATSVTITDLWAFRRSNSSNPQPVTSCVLTRETHMSGAQGTSSSSTYIQCKLSYVDGAGGVIQSKIEAEDDSSGGQRWVCSGWSVQNRQGSIARTYEPFYTSTSAWEFNALHGVATTNFYDPLGRAVGVVHPDHTWSKTRFTPWMLQTWDAAQTVSLDPKLDPDLGNHFRRLPVADYLPSWYQQRIGGALGPDEQRAATQSAIFSNLDTISFLDSLGRRNVNLVENRWQRSDESSPNTTTLLSRSEVDIQGRTHAITDLHGRIVTTYDYNTNGSLLHSASMDAAEKWFLSDMAGNALYSWNSRGYRFKTLYDDMRRPIGSSLKLKTEQEIQIGRTVYGDTLPQPETMNLRGQVYDTLDQSGRRRNVSFDFKGNTLRSERINAKSYEKTFDVLTQDLESETFVGETAYDALNRPIEATSYQAASTPLKSTITPKLDRTGLLKSVTVIVPGKSAVEVITDITYSAKNQRESIDYGCGTSGKYQYDELTTRLLNLTTTRPDGSHVQSLSYTYDCMGSIIGVADAAQQTIFFNNVQVDASSKYTYDATGQLIESSGREHIGQSGPTAPGPWDPILGLNGQSPRDGKAMARYTERYYYDEVGNIISIKHAGSDASTPGWTRRYTYNEKSYLEPTKLSNRLSSTQVGSVTDRYSYDGEAGVAGMMTSMPNLSALTWGYNDLIQTSSTQKVSSGLPETTWFQYDSQGARTRKVTTRQATAGEQPTRKSERIYVGAFEIYREYAANGADITLERQTLGVMDGNRRLLIAESRTIGPNDAGPASLFRYQLGNHLGSACVELDENSALITYEEYTPFGSSSYSSARSAVEAPKRYRFASRERDSETGLYNYGARCYAPWIGRWVSADPLTVGPDGTNVYSFVRNNPIMLSDLNGKQSNGGGSGIPPSRDTTIWHLFMQGNWMTGMAEIPDPSDPSERVLFGPSLTLRFGTPNDRSDASRHGTKMHRMAADYALPEAKDAGVEGADEFFGELGIRKADDALVKIGGSPVTKARNPDLVRLLPGQTIVSEEQLRLEGKDPAGATKLPNGSVQRTYDYKAGSGDIAKSLSDLGQTPGETVNYDFAEDSPNVNNAANGLPKLPSPEPSLPANEADFSGVLDGPMPARPNPAPKPPATTPPAAPVSAEPLTHEPPTGSAGGISGGSGSSSSGVVGGNPGVGGAIGTTASRMLNPLVEPVEESLNALSNVALMNKAPGAAATLAAAARATPAVGLAMVGGAAGGAYGEAIGAALGLGSAGRTILGVVGAAGTGALAAELVLGTGALVFGAPVLLVGAAAGLLGYGLSKLF